MTRAGRRPRYVTCPECDGDGYLDCSAPDTYQYADCRVDGFPAQRCRTCDGEGEVMNLIEADTQSVYAVIEDMPSEPTREARQGTVERVETCAFGCGCLALAEEDTVITVDTITDAQIRELRDRDHRHETQKLCAEALMVATPVHWPASVSIRAKARARCAEILNARQAVRP